MNDDITHIKMANAIRALSIDAVETAASGHPGMPLGTADIATILFTKYLKFDAGSPDWFNRDRFILSGGHGSMLLYSCLYLLGYEDLTIEQIKKFRQLDSVTAGHPEFGNAKGIETTTGPLGQGLGNAVGMAISEKLLSEKFGEDLIDHKTFVMVGDGDLMEGISQETLSLAGHLRLNKLTVLYDDNNITIDGEVSVADSTDQLMRFEASGWNVKKIDGHNCSEITNALEESMNSDKPTLIACKTHIGFGSPNRQDTSGIHGAPLGKEEYELTRKNLGIDYPAYEIPQDILDEWRLAGLRNRHQRKVWEKRFESLDADLKNKINSHLNTSISKEFEEELYKQKENLLNEPRNIATRKSSELVLGTINKFIPSTIGGSADLTGSNNTKTSETKSISSINFEGRYIHYGIREHAMGAIMNGIALHGGFIPYAGTFLIFSDYCRPAIRLSALMKQRVIYVMTHDSIGLGEDGPTHQPVEQLAALRAIPNLFVYRPANSVETLECWQLALNSVSAPSILALSRQNLPEFRKYNENYKTNKCAKGAYEVFSSSKKTKVTIFATGSEVKIAILASKELVSNDIETRVISVPCLDLFNDQDKEIKESFTKSSDLNVVVEAGVRQGWEHIIGDNGIFIGMDSFGASAPYLELYNKFGITTENIVDKVIKNLENN
ncbi:MAG: transketolase [Rhodobiaceae bacterium]|jgi:transketolase|nr:transketolase [Rhodobiaceae bacterium]MBT5640850.1 transketolase [Rhodobiaceae bacterium]